MQAVTASLSSASSGSASWSADNQTLVLGAIYTSAATPSALAEVTSYDFDSVDVDTTLALTAKVDLFAFSTTPAFTPPIALSLSPASGPPGTFVEITGRFLSGFKAILFGTLLGFDPEFFSDLALGIQVPAAALPGTYVVTVQSPAGDDTSLSFEVT